MLGIFLAIILVSLVVFAVLRGRTLWVRVGVSLLVLFLLSGLAGLLLVSLRDTAPEGLIVVPMESNK